MTPNLTKREATPRSRHSAKTQSSSSSAVPPTEGAENMDTPGHTKRSEPLKVSIGKEKRANDNIPLTRNSEPVMSSNNKSGIFLQTAQSQEGTKQMKTVTEHKDNENHNAAQPKFETMNKTTLKSKRRMAQKIETETRKAKTLKKIQKTVRIIIFCYRCVKSCSVRY